MTRLRTTLRSRCCADNFLVSFTRATHKETTNDMPMQQSANLHAVASISIFMYVWVAVAAAFNSIANTSVSTNVSVSMCVCVCCAPHCHEQWVTINPGAVAVNQRNSNSSTAFYFRFSFSCDFTINFAWARLHGMSEMFFDFVFCNFEFLFEHIFVLFFRSLFSFAQRKRSYSKRYYSG